MTVSTLVRSEIRKLTTTRMPLAFLAVLVVIAALNGVAVAFGTDMDGTTTFISTAADQRSLMAFAANALMIAGLFGAIAAAREHAHRTVVATYLCAPRRRRALRAQNLAIAGAGATIGLVGVGLTVVAVAAALPATEHGFMVGAAGLLQIAAASAGAGAAGAVLGAGIGNVVRNTGGAVAAAVVVLVVLPPVLVQLAPGAAAWVPSTIANVVSGVATDTTVAAAWAGLAALALLPATVAGWTVRHRDVV